MPKICLRYAQGMPNIFTLWISQYMPEICPRYAEDIPKICRWYAWDMPKIWGNLKNINQRVTDWLSNMDPRDASASKNTLYKKNDGFPCHRIKLSVVYLFFISLSRTDWKSNLQVAFYCSFCSDHLLQEAETTLIVFYLSAKLVTVYYSLEYHTFTFSSFPFTSLFCSIFLGMILYT